MKRKQTAKDELMDALLREDLKGGADEALLRELEVALDSGGSAKAERGDAHGRWSSLAWAALLIASTWGLFWLLPSAEQDDLAGMSREEESGRGGGEALSPANVSAGPSVMVAEAPVPSPSPSPESVPVRRQPEQIPVRPVPKAVVSGYDPAEYYEQVPPIKVDLEGLPPTSVTHMRIYPGPPEEIPSEIRKVRSSVVVIEDDVPQKRSMLLKDLDRYFTKEGEHTIEIVQNSPAGAELLFRNQIRVDRTIELKGGLFTTDGDSGGESHRGSFKLVPNLRATSTVVPPQVGREEWGDREALPVDRERYGQLVDQPWTTPWSAPLSTFSVDVDTASYTNIRRLLQGGQTIPKDAVRLEECVNYFDYAYPAPQNGGPFAVHVEMASCPWETTHHLVKIGLKGKEVDSNTRPPSNLVFLIDVSGSMNEPNKLPLLVESMKILVEELDERDSVGIVVYAGSAGTILEPTKVVGQGRTEVLSALDHLRAGGSTAGAAGIRGAYELAAKHYRKDGVNRVILATDGDFNVGTSSNGELVELVKRNAASGVFLSVLGFGTGNLNDSMMEAITNDGNGNYFYIDSQREGRKVFLQNLSGTLVTIAKDVKLQVEFNPGKVAAYRLIGYANRILRDEDFNNDKVDAGDIGAGHTVTALYEIVPAGVELPAIGGVDPLKYQKPAGREVADSPEWMTVKLRYKAPDGDKSSLIELPVVNALVAWEKASVDFQFAAGVALFGEKLRGSDKIGAAGWDLVADLAERGSARDQHGHRAEFRELVNLAGRTAERKAVPAEQNGAIEAPPAR